MRNRILSPRGSRAGRGCVISTLLVLLSLALCSAVQAKEKRDRNWLAAYVTQPIPDTARARRYLAFMNRSLDQTHLGLDVDWLQNGGGRVYRSRGQTSLIGQLAFCYRTKGLNGYQDPVLLEKLRLAYLAVAKHCTAEGQIFWAGVPDEYGAGSHEHAWRVEPLLLGYLWVGDKFPPADRKVIEAMLERATDWLVKHPNTETNNRGVVWCAVTTLCGLYYEKQEYLDVVERYADPIMKAVVLEDGEVGEHSQGYAGGGPDSNYSYTSWSYVYLYRLLSGKDEMDQRLLQAARWFALYNTLSGCPNVAGASVRMRYATPGNLPDVLPAFERFLRQEPFFATVVEHVVMKKERHLPGFGGHIVSPFIWALLECASRGADPAAPVSLDPASGGGNPKSLMPDWYVNHTRLYERPAVHYALVSRAYQTGVTFRGRTGRGYNYPLRGMQTFAFGDEYPILLHSDGMNSRTQADGVDTCLTDVAPHARGGWEVLLAEGGRLEAWRSNLATIVARQGTLWSLFAYTPVSAVVVYGGAKGPITSQWAMNRAFVPPPVLDAARRRVTFEGRKGCIHFLQGQPRLVSSPGVGEQDILEVVSAPPVNAFAFSDSSFRFLSYDAAQEELLFSDASGRYRLSLKSVLAADGDLDRGAGMRLVQQ